MKSPTFRAQRAVGEPTDAEQTVDAPSSADSTGNHSIRRRDASPEESDPPHSRSAPDLFQRVARPHGWGMIRNNVHTRSLSSLTSLLDGGDVAKDPGECLFDAQEKPLGSQTRSDKVNKGLARAVRVEMWRALKPKPEANNDAMASCNARKHVDDDEAEEGADMMLQGDIDIEREVQSLQRQFDAEQKANWKREQAAC